tara:strand:+ start:5638 stop:7977 length:2340 start_codon:yes stop_codon:yes gene_type:complete
MTSVLIALGFVLTLSSTVFLGADLEVDLLIQADRIATIAPPGWIGLGLLVSGLFIANMARMLQVWGALKQAIGVAPARRNAKQRSRARHGFRELFAYMFIETIAVTSVVYLSAEQHLPWTDLGLDGLSEHDAKPLHILVLVGCLVAAITPVCVALFLQARLGRTKERPLLRGDVISPASFYVGAFLFGGIVGLASWAGRVSSLPSDMSLLINLTIMFSVVAVFVAFIFIPHIARFLNSLSARNSDGSTPAAAGWPIQAPALMVSYLDSILVHIVAPLTGATQHGRGVPHGFVLLSLLPLTALGFVLAPPYGLIPIILGVLMIIALGRRWAWIEEDRETASRLLKTSSPEIQVGFENDLKDEALLGYATLFIFVPLALYQINGSTNVFEIHEVQNPFIAWLAFFGAELAKAVPFVDWWEIYNVDLNSPVTGVIMDIGGHETTAPLAKHLTFAARAMVDLVIMAALLQAIGIWQRTRTQRHLFEIGHVNHFDPFAERDFFESAFENKSATPKPKFVEKVQIHVDAREALKLPGEPYSPERLADLLKSENPKIRKTAKWMVSEYSILTGDASEQLSMLAQQWSAPFSFETLYENVRQAETQADRVHSKMAIRTEKLKFEKLLDELIELDASTSKWFSLPHTRTLLTLLERIKNLPEFVYAHSLAMDFLSERRGQFILFALAAHTLTDAADKAAPKWRTRIRGKFGWLPDVVLARSEMRQLIYDAMYRYADMCFAWSEISRIRETIEYLQLMSQTDAASAARARADELADRLIRRLRELLDEG